MQLPPWVKTGFSVVYNDFSAPLLNGQVQSGAITTAETELVTGVSGLTVTTTETAVINSSFTDTIHWILVPGQVGYSDILSPGQQFGPTDPTAQFWVDPNNPTESLCRPEWRNLFAAGVQY